eukprot:369882-Rhodomonas_salina.1
MVLWVPRHAGAPPKRGGLRGHCQIRGEGSGPVPSPRKEAKWAASTVKSVSVARTALGFFRNGMGCCFNTA